MSDVCEEMRNVEEVVDVPVSPLEGYAAILKELDEAQDEMKLIKKGLKEMWQHIREDELTEAVTMTTFIEAEAEKMAEATKRTSAQARAFRDAFIRRGGEGWHY